MQDGTSFVSLCAAIEKALCLGGVELLNSPQKLKTYVRDLADNTLPEVRLFMRQADVELLEPLKQVSRTSDEASLRALVTRIAQTLVHDRFVEKDLAVKTSNELVAGVARYWGVSFSIPPSSPKPPSSPIEPTPAPSPSYVATPTPQVKQVNVPTTPQVPYNQPQPSAARAQAPAPTINPMPQQVPQQTPQQAPQAHPNTHSGSKLLIALLFALVVVGVGTFAYFQFSRGVNTGGDSSSEATAEPHLIHHVSIPQMDETDSVRTLSQTENELKQDWILFANTDSDCATSVLMLTNLSNSYKDVELTFHFFDASNTDVGTEDITVWSLAPGETTCVHSSGKTGTVDSTYYYTIYDARNQNAISLGECISSQVLQQNSSGLTIRLTNDGNTNAHLYKVFVFGTNERNASQWSSSTWCDDDENELPGILGPHESVDISFEGGLWEDIKVDVFPIGYADAS